MSKIEIITANQLLSGATVYFQTDGSWQQDLSGARAFSSSEVQIAEKVIETALNSGQLLSVERETVHYQNGEIVAFRLRERIRASGPTTPRHQPQRPEIQETEGARDVSV